MSFHGRQLKLLAPYCSVLTYQDLLNSDFRGISCAEMLEVLVPPYALVNFLQEANDFSNVRVVILGNADLATNILVVGRTHLYTGKKVNERG